MPFAAIDIAKEFRTFVKDIEASVPDDLDANLVMGNGANPRPFRWIKPTDQILASIDRVCLKNLLQTNTT